MFDKYYLYNSVSAGKGCCEKGCKTAQICGITKIDFDQYDQCLSGLSAAHTLNGSSLISFVLLHLTSILYY